MPSPDPLQSPPAPSRSDDEFAAAREWAEREVASQLRRVWRLLPGRFPWITILWLVASIVISVSGWVYSDRTYEVFYATGWELWAETKWWGLVGSAFLHGDFLHLVFNCYWIWIFGRLIERELGPGHYLGFTLAAAWMSSVAELGGTGEMGIGLSGVSYAFFGYLLLGRSSHPDFERILSPGIIRLLLGWLVACFLLTYTGVYAIANFAHVGGLVFGSVLGVATYRDGWRKRGQIAAALLVVWSFQPLLWCPWHEDWRLAQAYRALVTENDDRALHLLEKISAKNPTNEWALEEEAKLRLQRGEYAIARNRLDVLAADSREPRVLNALAWLLATCPEADVRDGLRAIALATRACSHDGFKDSAYLDTLAAAYAEAGDFAAAERWMLKALENAKTHRALLEQHLAQFRSGQPWRER